MVKILRKQFWLHSILANHMDNSIRIFLLKDYTVAQVESLGCCKRVANTIDRTQWFHSRRPGFESLWVRTKCRRQSSLQNVPNCGLQIH